MALNRLNDKRILNKWQPVVDNIRKNHKYTNFDNLELSKYCEKLQHKEPTYSTLSGYGMGPVTLDIRRSMKDSIAEFVLVYAKYGIKVDTKIIKKYREEIDKIPDDELYLKSTHEILMSIIIRLIRKEKLKQINEASN